MKTLLKNRPCDILGECDSTYKLIVRCLLMLQVCQKIIYARHSVKNTVNAPKNLLSILKHRYKNLQQYR